MNNGVEVTYRRNGEYVTAKADYVPQLHPDAPARRHRAQLPEGYAGGLHRDAARQAVQDRPADEGALLGEGRHLRRHFLDAAGHPADLVSRRTASIARKAWCSARTRSIRTPARNSRGSRPRIASSSPSSRARRSIPATASYVETGVSVAWHQMNHMLGCAAQWDEALCKQWFTTLQAPVGQSLPDRRPGELSPGLAGRRDRLGASRHRATSTRANAPARRWRHEARRSHRAARGTRLARARRQPRRPENKFDYCLLCHGANANGNAGIRAPKLSGMEPWYLARQLENFAAGVRGTPAGDAAGHEMGPVGLRVKAEGALEAAVAFIGTLESKRPAPTVTGDVAHGKTLYATCAACHGAKGEGNADAAGARAGGALGLVSRHAAQRTTRMACAAPMRATPSARRCARSSTHCRMTRPSPMSWPTSTR